MKGSLTISRVPRTTSVPRSRFDKFNTCGKWSSATAAVQKPRQEMQKSLSGHQVQGSAFVHLATVRPVTTPILVRTAVIILLEVVKV
jgi:hypothetical protein